MGNKKKLVRKPTKKSTKVKPSDLGRGTAAISAKKMVSAHQRRNKRLAEIMGNKQRKR